MEDKELLQLEGRLTKVIYAAPDGLFRVAKFVVTGVKEPIVIAGNLGHVAAMTPVELYGFWDKYSGKNGQEIMQFKVRAAIYAEATTLAEMENLLASSISGCGPKRAKLLVNHFGASIKQILEERPDRLIEIPGIGPETVKRIAQGWKETTLERHITKFLNSIGVGTNWARPIMRDLGPDAVNIISKNPYRLVEVAGIGFKKADEIALKLGWTKNSAERTESVILYTLEKAADDGHCYLPRPVLIEKAAKEGEIEAAAVNKAIAEILQRQSHRTVVLEKAPAANAGDAELIYLPRLYSAEKGLADRLACMLKYKPLPPFEGEQLVWFVRESEKALGMDLTDEQRSAVVQAFTQPVSILTGGPGTGKTAVVRVIVHAAQKRGFNLKLCAPTGRAAQNMAEVSSAPAQTIHMMLEYNADLHEWQLNSKNPLKADMVIADEFSMSDIELAYRVADAVPNGKPLVLIGDKDQLPAVSPGKVLDDLISCGLIPVTRLNKIWRQAAKSMIIQNAHRVLKGEKPSFAKSPEMNADCFLQSPPMVDGEQKTAKGKPKKVEDYQWIKDRLILLCQKMIPERMNINPIRDIQVLAPMKKGECGVLELNTVLQEVLNPKPDGPEGDGAGPQEICWDNGGTHVKRFRAGDRVIVTSNNYKITPHLYNGDIGFVTSIDDEEKLIHVDFGGERCDMPLPYDLAQQDLQLGYAISVHKSQGGEFPAVVVVLLKRNWIMLQRNLLYTAMTRAKGMLIFISSEYVLEQCVKTASINQRNSYLAQRFHRAVKLLQQAA